MITKETYIIFFSFTRKGKLSIGQGCPNQHFFFSAVVPCLRRRPCYSPLSPPDFVAARPKKEDRYDQPKGCSLNAATTTKTSCRLLPLFTPETYIASWGFCKQKAPFDPSRGPHSNSPPGSLTGTGGPAAQSSRDPASPPESLRSSRPLEASANSPNLPGARGFAALKDSPLGGDGGGWISCSSRNSHPYMIKNSNDKLV